MTRRAITIAWLAAALLWGLWWISDTRLDQRAAQEQSGSAAGFAPLFPAGTVPWKEIDRVTLKRGESVRWEWVRGDGGWRQVSPFEFPIDGAIVDEQLALLAGLSAHTVGSGVDSEGPAESIAADGPVVSLHWGNATTSIALGRRLPAGCAWVAVDGAPRVARDDIHGAFLGADLKRWRRTSLFERADVECECLTSTAVAADGSVQRLEVRRDGPSWKLVSPVTTRADREAVERWLDALARARATGFVVDRPTDVGAFGLADPLATVEIRSVSRTRGADGAVVITPVVERLEIGAPIRAGASEHFARLAAHPEAIMEIDAAAVAAAMPPALSLVDATATGLRPADIRAIRLAPKDGSIARLERAGADWTLTDERGARAASSRAVEGLLSRICGDRATDIASGSAPSELFIGLIAVEGFDGRVLAEFSVSREVDAGRFGIDDHSGVLRIFPKSSALYLDGADYEVRDPSRGPLVPPVPLPR